MIKLKKYNNQLEINELYKKHLDKQLIPNDNVIEVLYDDSKIVGYVVYKLENKQNMDICS